MFMPNWSAKVEYLYYDLGTVNYAAGLLVGARAGAPRYGVAPQISRRYNGNIVRAGINYHFNWGAPPVMAKY
ncbi:MAG: outer membrane protein [Methylocystis sp.]